MASFSEKAKVVVEPAATHLNALSDRPFVTQQLVPRRDAETWTADGEDVVNQSLREPLRHVPDRLFRCSDSRQLGAGRRRASGPVRADLSLMEPARPGIDAFDLEVRGEWRLKVESPVRIRRARTGFVPRRG